jgi:hypothetical protein
MDTRFWGPSGWRLLHLIAADRSVPERKEKVKEWFDLLEYVLPCKYCRASFHDYTQLQPLTLEIMDSADTFGKWLYDIHNRVNGKLRGQGLLSDCNPSWPAIKRKYEALQRGLCDSSPLLGWDFMTSVAFTTPAADYDPVPMPDTPEPATDWNSLDLHTRNRYNLLTRAERLEKLSAWWRLIPSILPCGGWRKAWSNGLKESGYPPLIHGRASVMRWMWKLEENVCVNLKCPTPHSSLPAMRAELAAFESNCGKSKSRRNKTCRAVRRKRLLTRRTQQRGPR